MTKNVFQAFDFINREGLDNSQWGLQCGASERSLAEVFPVNPGRWGSVSCPQSFLYIQVNLKTADRLSRLNLQPAWIMYAAPDGENYQEAIFIWEIRAED